MPRAPWLTCLTESTNSITSLTLWRTRPVSALTSSTVMGSAKTNLFLLRWRKRTLYTFSLVILSFVIQIFCIRHILTVNYRKICLMICLIIYTHVVLIYLLFSFLEILADVFFVRLWYYWASLIYTGPVVQIFAFSLKCHKSHLFSMWFYQNWIPNGNFSFKIN